MNTKMKYLKRIVNTLLSAIAAKNKHAPIATSSEAVGLLIALCLIIIFLLCASLLLRLLMSILIFLQQFVN